MIKIEFGRGYYNRLVVLTHEVDGAGVNSLLELRLRQVINGYSILSGRVFHELVAIRIVEIGGCSRLHRVGDGQTSVILVLLHARQGTIREGHLRAALISRYLAVLIRIGELYARLDGLEIHCTDYSGQVGFDIEVAAVGDVLLNL